MISRSFKGQRGRSSEIEENGGTSQPRRGRTCIIIAVSCPVSLGRRVGEGGLALLRVCGHSLSRLWVHLCWNLDDMKKIFVKCFSYIFSRKVVCSIAI